MAAREVTDPWAPTPHARFDIRLSAAGMTVGPSAGSRAVVPSLVAWSELIGFSADQWVTTADGATGQILEVVVGGLDAGGPQIRRFLVPAPDLVLFFRGVGTWSTLWAADLRGTNTGRGRGSRRAASGVPSRGLSNGYRATAVRMASWVPSGVARRLGGAADREDTSAQPRVGTAVVALVVLVLAAGLAAGSLAIAASGGAPHHRASAPVTHHVPVQLGNVIQAAAAPKVAPLPAATTAPAPAPPSLAGSPPLQSHEVFGYAPYWTLPESSGFDVSNLTTLAYFSVDANADGTLDQSGSGWNGYESQDLATLVTRSHAAGDRVVLTVTDFNQHSLDQITSDPNAPGRLSAALIAAVAAKNLDGVNFDFEGVGSADRAGLTKLITQVSNALHAANPHWQTTMAVYASAASDLDGFYDVAALAPALDGFFVMAYDMNDPVTPSATAPLVGGGYNDTETLQQFTAVVPAAKVVLGVPYYGYDWPTASGSKGAPSTGPDAPLSYGVITSANNPTYWDPSTQTAWTSYLVGTQWHQTYFDNPTSMALKAQLANSFHIRGVGIWALGMDGNDPAMLAALLGQAPAAKDFAPGPTTTTPSSSTTVPPTTAPSTSTAPPTTTSPVYTSSGTWQGRSVTLTPVATRQTLLLLGNLSAFKTNDPHLSCLATGPPLQVWSSIVNPNVYIVVASQPQDCASGLWSFPTSGSSPTTTTTGGPATSTTTTAPNLLGIPLVKQTSP
ncbi:MAG TPA: glycosyl hydrolase family 18 protein [Acidimicrobiales bacterium]|nr:glycosyl hydrolase family 18 protein [Acidimicrobiales bacterium]